MIRSMFQVYLSNAKEAIALYQQALNATLLELVPTEDGRYVYHSELDVYGQILAVADRDVYGKVDTLTGNTMQFCLHFDKADEAIVKHAYTLLSKDGTVNFPLGPTDYSSLTCDLTDRFGVRWCIFTA